jgi:hypothetical protein
MALDGTPEVHVTKKMKVFLPRWVLAVVLPMLAVLWAIVTYVTFATPQGQDLGVLGWLGVTVVILLVGVMLWLMTGRLPAYIIQIEDADDSAKR